MDRAAHKQHPPHNDRSREVNKEALHLIATPPQDGLHLTKLTSQLYRCLFENNRAKFQIMEDLHRGRPSKLPDFDVSGSGELEQAQ